jgi:hypothetical protein
VRSDEDSELGCHLPLFGAFDIELRQVSAINATDLVQGSNDVVSSHASSILDLGIFLGGDSTLDLVDLIVDHGTCSLGRISWGDPATDEPEVELVWRIAE